MCLYWASTLVLLFGTVGVGMATYLCYYVCARNGVYKIGPDGVCFPQGEDPCVGTCEKYTFTANVTCYDCDVVTSSSTCTPGGPVVVPASYWITSCGQHPISGVCICIEPWIPRDSQTSFTCYTTVAPTDTACVVW